MKRTLKSLVCVLIIATVISLQANVSASFSGLSNLQGINTGGCILDDENTIQKYLIEDNNKAIKSTANSLPSFYDMTNEFPTPGNQGIQGSCTAWAVGYALKSYQEHLDHNWKADVPERQFSPAYIYNQLVDNIDEGTSIIEVANLVINQGVCTLNDMPYNQYSCANKPTTAQRAAAAKFKGARLGVIATLDQMKEYLAVKRTGIVISIPSFDDLHDLSPSNPIYDVGGAINSNTTYHAICLIGYDDSKQAFKFINSWGTDWGLNGYGYISYNFWKNYSKYGYVITDTITQVGDWVLGAVSGDFNGDNKTDVASVVDMKTWNMQLQVQLSDGESFQDPKVWFEESGYSGSKISNRITSGDFNGDGKDDIALMYRYDLENGRNRMGIFVYTSTGTKFEGKRWFYDDFYTADNVHGFLAGDVNGDGKDDIVVLYDNGIHDGRNRMTLHVFASNGTTFNSRDHWFVDNWFTSSKVYGFSVGDYTGDGKDDVAVLYDSGDINGEAQSNFYVYPSTGSSFLERQTWLTEISYFAPHVNMRMVSGDFNGDGLDDLAVMYDNGAANGNRLMTLQIVCSNKNRFDNYRIGFRDYNDSFTCDFVRNCMVGDYNGDGFLDISCLYQSSVSELKFLNFLGNQLSFSKWRKWCPAVLIKWQF